MPEIRMVQQMSGRRPDGRLWPPVGGTLVVSTAEARELCHTVSQQSHPIAVLVRDDRSETATPGKGAEEKAVMPEGDGGQHLDEAATESADPRPVRRAARPEPRPARPVEKRA